MAIEKLKKPYLGKLRYAQELGVKVDEVINTVNEFTDGSVTANEINETTSGSGVTVDSALIKDGSFIGKQATATVTVDGLTTGLLTGADQFVTVTSANAVHILSLPSNATVPVGTVIRGWVGANGFELRSLAADTTVTVNDIVMGVTNEAAVPADTFFVVKKVTATGWLLTAETKLGAVLTAIVPDAV